MLKKKKVWNAESECVEPGFGFRRALDVDVQTLKAINIVRCHCTRPHCKPD